MVLYDLLVAKKTPIKPEGRRPIYIHTPQNPRIHQDAGAADTGELGATLASWACGRMSGRSAETGGRWKAMYSPLRKAMPAVKAMATRNPARDGMCTRLRGTDRGER